MSFLAPSAFLLGLLLPLIVLLYLLKLKRIEQPVSSTYLWQRMVRDVEANSPWQRLRRNLLLFLQLLFLLLLIFALARPFNWQSGLSAQSAILILDTSASMGATDVSPTRLSAAKQQAHRLVDDLPDSARLTVIEAGAKVRVAASASLDRRQAHQAIDQVQQGAGSSDLAVALQLASAIASRQPDAQVILLSDGRSDLPERLSLPGNLVYYPIGLRGENQAVSLLTLQTEPGRESLTAFVQVTHYGTTPVERRLGIYLDNTLQQAFDLSLQPAEQRAVIVEGLPTTIHLVEARLSPPDDPVIDDLPSDDQAFAPWRQTAPRRVTLVSSGNRFLETALSLQPAVQLTLVTPTSTLSLPAADLTIFDNAQPVDLPLPQGALLWVNPIRSTEFFTITGSLANPVPVPASDGATLLNNVSLDTVNILDSLQLSAPDWLHPQIVTQTEEGATYPLLLSGENQGQRLAVLAFDLRRSDLPLQIAFPILLNNLLEWLAPGGQATPTQLSPDDLLTLSVPLSAPSDATVQIQPPQGPAIRLQATQGQVRFSGTQQLGLYQVRWLDTAATQTNDQPQPSATALATSDPTSESAAVTEPGISNNGYAHDMTFAVNLFSPQESDTRPLDSLVIAGQPLSAGAQDSDQLSRREWWRALAFLALGVLTAEWLVYHRAALARLRERFKTLTTKRREGVRRKT